MRAIVCKLKKMTKQYGERVDEAAEAVQDLSMELGLRREQGSNADSEEESEGGEDGVLGPFST